MNASFVSRGEIPTGFHCCTPPHSASPPASRLRLTSRVASRLLLPGRRLRHVPMVEGPKGIEPDDTPFRPGCATRRRPARLPVRFHEPSVFRSSRVRAHLTLIHASTADGCWPSLASTSSCCGPGLAGAIRTGSQKINILQERIFVFTRGFQ